MPRLLAALVVSLVLPATASAASPDVVISQVYGGGGNSGATLKNDYVELFNRGAAAADLSGWEVQYGSAGGTGFSGTTNLSGALAPGRHYLVQEAAGAGGTQDLPAPDAAGNIAMSATAGKVQVLTAAGETRDLVGYGGANQFEGTPAPGLSNTTADLRAGNGCVDTDDNGADFTAGAPTPRNVASEATPCGGDAAPAVASSDPADGASDVATGATLSVTFTEPVNVASGAFTLACGGQAIGLDVSGGGDSFTLDPQQDLPRESSCALTVHASAVTDVDADDPPDAMDADRTLRFSTVGLALRIHDIQGAAQVSPVAGHLVSGVPGVVTAKASNGFYLEDPQPDDDPRTSEGVFVFGSPAGVAVGDAVTVSGRVQEFRPGGANSSNLTTTEIGSPTVTRTGSGSIAPTVIGQGGRVPPPRTIEDDASGDVGLTDFLFDPEQDGIDFWESLEGMLVQVDDAQAVGPTNGFDETPVVAGGTASPATPRGGVLLRPDDANPERFILDDDLVPAPRMNVGDTYAEPLRAVVDYDFGNFMLHATVPPVRVDNGLQPEVANAPRNDQLAIASLNVENLAATDPPDKFDRLAHILVENLRSPDLVALEEIQDNDGEASEGDSDASATWARFIAAVKAAGGPDYEYRQIDPVPGQDGGAPGGNIRQGFLFRTDRGLHFVDRPGATATAPDEVLTDGGVHLKFSPGRLEPNDLDAFHDSRKPLAGEFEWRGRRLFVIANHFNSKSGDQPLFGRFQPPARPSEEQRHLQAGVVRDFVREILAADARANVVVLGDLNDFDYSQTVDILRGGGLNDLVDTLPVDERYTYVFEGNSQVLDQILVSDALMRPKPQYDSVHVNSEFADQASDHDPQLARVVVNGGAKD